MAERCSFCGFTAGPFSKVEGLFTVLMCPDCQATRGRGSGPYPVMTRAQMRAGLDLLPTWALEQKASAFSVLGVGMRGVGWRLRPARLSPKLERGRRVFPGRSRPLIPYGGLAVKCVPGLA
jgi:hypothetical protein